MDIVLVAGLWLDGSAWDDVVSVLVDLGHQPVPLTLPGQGDGSESATLDDQVTAVVAAVDSASGKALVVGHSAACSLAWLAADRRPDSLAGVVLVGGMPAADGEVYFGLLEPTDGAVGFPGWDTFDGPDSADLDRVTKRAFETAAIPVPEEVTQATVHLADPRRFDVPVTLVCPEFSPAQAREWIDAGEMPELAQAAHLDLVDIDSGHWPMFTKPAELARILAAVAGDAHDDPARR
ncbi:MAG: alpha/beta hydrolase [Microlunatus sp.]|nr:alpha/beta hydrolase [Microlunatus sp.]MDN5770526.1 alpha/beta hydrolase [Microlunatus sp.]MDN5803548.1 alpha/beta hydrolase [Microlunatus sp.]